MPLFLRVSSAPFCFRLDAALLTARRASAGAVCDSVLVLVLALTVAAVSAAELALLSLPVALVVVDSVGLITVSPLLPTLSSAESTFLP